MKKPSKKADIACVHCGKFFATKRGCKIHVTRMHGPTPEVEMFGKRPEQRPADEFDSLLNIREHLVTEIQKQSTLLAAVDVLREAFSF